MALPLPTTGPISIGGLQGYYGGSPSNTNLFQYYDADWGKASDAKTTNLSLGNMRGTSKEKLRLVSVHQDATSYTTGQTVSIAVPTTLRPWGRYNVFPAAPLIGMLSFAVETTNNKAISYFSVYPVTPIPTPISSSHSSTSFQATHPSGYGYTGVVNRLIWIPSSFTGTYTFSCTSDTRIVGTTAHFILPSLPNFSNLSTNTHTDISLYYNAYQESSNRFASQAYNTNARVQLFSAYSDGITNITDPSVRPSVTHTTQSLTTALGIVDRNENPGTFSVEFNNYNGMTTVAGSYISDSTAWGAYW
jgi:hypothetical protein